MGAVVVLGGRGRRRKKDRGLPSEPALLDLARTYLETQRRLWPSLVETGELPEIDDAVLQSMADEFRSRFLAEPDELPLPSASRLISRGDAAIYLRYSSDNSSPRSLDQQLRLTLERVRSTNHFVPWSLVFADSGVTGTVAARRGYRMMQQAYAENRAIKVLCFDDLSRLSRDMAESTRLCRSLHESGVRVLGASDGFDTDMEQYKALLGVAGLVHEFYIDGLKKKVDRGMADGFRQGKNLQPAAFGYKLVPVTTADGQPVLNRKRQQELKLTIDEEQAEIVREVFRRYLEGGKSLQMIARWLNEIAAGGRQAWGPSQVGDLLDRPIYIGIQIWGRSRQKKDRETGSITEVKRPRSEWQVRRVRHLQIVNRKTWKAIRKLRAERAKLFAKGSRGRAATYPTRLLSLVCGGCGAALVLGKSGQYAQVRCPNASEGKRGCSFSGYKSLKKVEQTVLSVVTDYFADAGLIEAILAEANLAIEELANAPKPNLVPLQSRVRELTSERDRLVEAIAASDTAVAVLAPRLEDTQRKLEAARSALAAAKGASGEPPEPLTAEMVQTMLQDVRDLLGDEPSIAAPALRGLLGDVIVTQQVEPGCDKRVWYAEFSCDLFKVIGHQYARANGCNSVARLARHVADKEPLDRIRLRLDPLPKPPKPKKLPRYVELAEPAAQLRKEGLTFKEIGSRLGVHEVTATRACDHAQPKERPVKGRKRPQEGKAARTRRRLLELFAEGRSLSEAAREVGCSEMIARRAQKQFCIHIDEAA